MAACKIAAVGKLQLNNGDKATGSLMSLHDMKITRWRFSRSHGTLITLTPTPLPRGRGKKVRKSDRSADASEASSLASFSLPKKAELSKGVLKKLCCSPSKTTRQRVGQGGRSEQPCEKWSGRLEGRLFLIPVRIETGSPEACLFFCFIVCHKIKLLFKIKTLLFRGRSP